MGQLLSSICNPVDVSGRRRDQVERGEAFLLQGSEPCWLWNGQWGRKYRLRKIGGMAQSG